MSQPPAPILYLDALAPERGGHEKADVKDRRWWFPTVADALACAAELGARPTIPSELLGRQYAVLRTSSRGYLILDIPALPNDSPPRNAEQRKKTWTIPLGVQADQRSDKEKSAAELERLKPYDDIVRAIVAKGSNGTTDQGWRVKTRDGRWTNYDTIKVRYFLMNYADDPLAVMGMALRHPWRVVSIPFGPDEPGERQWNLNAPQLRHKPAPGDHPHWTRILEHVSSDLNEPLTRSEWGQRHGILTGEHYFRVLLANLIRCPENKWPYVFLCGPQNSGKSIVGEAIDECLITSGVVRADRALTNQNDFNGELAGALVCLVEEKDLSTSAGARAKLKDLVTALNISIRKMRTDSYMEKSYLHWIQTANTRNACPVEFGDSRVLYLFVPPLADEIPKPILLDILKSEAPAFIASLLDMPLPEPEGRLCCPVIETSGKTAAMEQATDEFIAAIVAAVDQTLEFTATELDELLGIGQWPRNMRGVESRLTNAQAFLNHHGIEWSFTIHPKSKAKICKLTRRSV